MTVRDFNREMKRTGNEHIEAWFSGWIAEDGNRVREYVIREQVSENNYRTWRTTNIEYTHFRITGEQWF